MSPSGHHCRWPNRAPTLEDGILPLRIWLENAADLLGPRGEAMVITSALTWLDVERRVLNCDTMSISK